MSFLNIFKISYYFDSYSLSTFPGFWAILVITVIALGASVWLKVKSDKWSYVRREITARITGPIFLVSWLNLLWLFFRYEGVVILSWRLWPALMIGFLIYSGVMLWRWIKIELPKKQAKRETNADTKQHYLRRFKNQSKKK
ncbi:MAG: hypothetical protein R3B38_02495 [Patescibacteria group bacterium]